MNLVRIAERWLTASNTSMGLRQDLPEQETPCSPRPWSQDIEAQGATAPLGLGMSLELNVGSPRYFC